MKLHANAKTTPLARELLVRRVRAEGWAVRQAAEAAGISVRTAYKWLARYREEGRSGLADRSSRPRHCPNQTAPRVVRRVEELRRRRLTAWEIAERVPVAPSTVSRILRRIGLGKLWRLEPEQPVRRYEHSRPGALVHIDAKRILTLLEFGTLSTSKRASGSPTDGSDLVDLRDRTAIDRE